jgi:hypothetical protein
MVRLHILRRFHFPPKGCKDLRLASPVESVIVPNFEGLGGIVLSSLFVSRGI